VNGLDAQRSPGWHCAREKHDSQHERRDAGQ